MARGAATADPRTGSAGEVFVAALRLGLTSFGGAIAHLGIFQREYVGRRRWLDDSAFSGLVAMSQVLPGPASSQVGISVGLLRAGYPGALAAWLGFTLPSAVLMIGLALASGAVDLANAGWVHGLELAAAVIVAAATVTLWRGLAPDAPRSAIVLAASIVLVTVGGAAVQPLVLVAAALVGRWLLRPAPAATEDAAPRGGPVKPRAAFLALAMFGVLLIGLPALAAVTGSPSLAAVDAFYRAGSLVFGGGHVVLPLLDQTVVTPGWVTEEQFLAGYGAAQALPGPLFTFAGYLGALAAPLPQGVAGGVIAIVAIFLPSFLLVIGAFPFWEHLRTRPALRGALAGVNAAVVGLLLAALYDPVLTRAVQGPADVLLIATAFAAVHWRNAPPWLVVAALTVIAELLRSGLPA